MSPAPPYLVIREALAFWREERPPDRVSATLQAFEEGCYAGALCYDRDGRTWPVTRAELRRPPSLADRLLPWRQLPVVLHLGPPQRVATDEIVAASRTSCAARASSPARCASPRSAGSSA